MQTEGKGSKRVVGRDHKKCHSPGSLRVHVDRRGLSEENVELSAYALKVTRNGIKKGRTGTKRPGLVVDCGIVGIIMGGEGNKGSLLRTLCAEGCSIQNCPSESR